MSDSLGHPGASPVQETQASRDAAAPGNPFSSVARGFRSWLRGIAWLRRHPGWFAALMVPMLMGVVAFVSGLAAFVAWSDTIFAWVLFARPETVLLLAVWYLAKAFVALAMLVMSALLALTVVSVVAAPLYEMVSEAVEREYTGQAVVGTGFLGSIRLIGEEIKKAIFILIVPTLFLFIPGVNVLATLVAALLIGWDFCDYPMARRGWSFRRRLRFVLRDGWAVLGFGLWLVIPFVQIFLMPLSVPGGTLLILEALEREGELAPRPGLTSSPGAHLGL